MKTISRNTDKDIIWKLNECFGRLEEWCLFFGLVNAPVLGKEVVEDP